MQDILKPFASIIEKMGTAEAIVFVLIVFTIWTIYRWADVRIDRERRGVTDLLRQIDALKDSLQQAQAEHEKELERIASDRVLEEAEEIREQRAGLRHHPFFADMDYWVQIKIPAMAIPNDFKRAVFGDLLRVKFQAARDGWRELVEQDLEEMGPQTFRMAVVKCITQQNTAFSREVEARRIPEVAVRKLSAWASLSEKFLFTAASNICASDAYDTNTSKAYAILNVALAAYETLLPEAESSLDEMNGELVGETYAGMTCGPDDEPSSVSALPHNEYTHLAARALAKAGGTRAFVALQVGGALKLVALQQRRDAAPAPLFDADGLWKMDGAALALNQQLLAAGTLAVATPPQELAEAGVRSAAYLAARKSGEQPLAAIIGVHWDEPQTDEALGFALRLLEGCREELEDVIRSAGG